VHGDSPQATGKGLDRVARFSNTQPLARCSTRSHQFHGERTRGRLPRTVHFQHFNQNDPQSLASHSPGFSKIAKSGSFVRRSYFRRLIRHPFQHLRSTPPAGPSIPARVNRDTKIRVLGDWAGRCSRSPAIVTCPAPNHPALLLGGLRRCATTLECDLSEILLPKGELEIATNGPYLMPEAAGPAEEDLDGLGPMLFGDLRQLLLPVGAAHVRLALQPRK